MIGKKIIFLVLVLTLQGMSFAQHATLTGHVNEKGSSVSLPGVTIRLHSAAGESNVRGAFTDLSGDYTITNLEPGEYKLNIMSLGYKQILDLAISIKGNETIRKDAELEEMPINMDAIIVSASRKAEKAIEAPASTSVLDHKQISERATLAPSDHIRGLAGVDIAQTGITQQNIVVRGFNNPFSTTLTMLTDNRIASVPSLRVNVSSFIPLTDDDIERIELVRGPGSALYGPNVTSGVLNIITRSPFASRGTSISIAGGNQSLFQGSIRHAGMIGENIGFKLSGQYMRVNDWQYTDPVEQRSRDEAIATGVKADTLLIGKRDNRVERFGGEARLDFLLTDDLSANLTFGMNQAVRTLELTDLGAAQGKDWRYTFLQGRINYGDLFVQAFLNKSDAGDTYLLRSGNRIVDRSTQFVVQAQHAYSFGATERLTYGADLHFTRPVTDGTIDGVNENKDDVNEYGAYVQSETHLVENTLDLVLAGRMDKHNRLEDIVFSPRAAIVFKPWENQNFRLTFNRSYMTPLATELFLDILSAKNVFGFPGPLAAYGFDLRAAGSAETGFSFARDENGRPYFYSTFVPDRTMPIPVDAAATVLWPLILQQTGLPSQLPAPNPGVIRSLMAKLNTESASFEPSDGPIDIPRLKPTINQTVELGYKGIIGDKLQAGVDLYYSRYNDFIGPYLVVTPNVFLHPGDFQKYLEQLGVPSDTAALIAAGIASLPLGTVTPKEAVDPTAVLLGVRNYGKVDLMGIDLSLDYRIDDMFSCSAVYSFVNKNFFENLEGVDDLSLNAPRNKAALTLRYHNSDIGISAEVRDRWTEGFKQHSGVYIGSLPSYQLIDVNVSYIIPGLNGAAFTLTALNLLDKKHQEFIGAPMIGRLAMARLQYAF